ncbi:N-acetylmuramoyl-L-alanine amidase family protein [Parablastomonas sp. CN1-191]|uniref:N-acetylmuramoyl-L-alanine amidase family protein n=1 Tax=Parablastomonas sp. CN1-191 TaxID=3400908 RepID=UPI003BF7A40D
MAPARRTAMLAAAPFGVVLAVLLADRLIAHPGSAERAVTLSMPAAAPPIGLPPILGPDDPARPLVLIDAGHGGHDPGAGADIKEKDVTLALALSLRDALLASKAVRVALTRSDDRYLLLPERLALAETMQPAAFVSIHADSAASADASGATVYTLSQRGSSDVAARFAARENASDRLNGATIKGADAAVGAILLDLSQRGTLARSHDLARLIVREADGVAPFREEAEQSAAFVVLKTSDVPAVLFESGYLSNPGDAARLADPGRRKAVGEALSRAIRSYLARQAFKGR